MPKRNIRILTSVNSKKDLSVSGSVSIKADSQFVVPTISTGSNGSYSLNDAIHQIDTSLQIANSRIVSSVGNVLNQYNASRYVFSGYLDGSGSTEINITQNSPSGSSYFTVGDINNLSVNILTDVDGDGIFTNNLIPYQLKPISGDVILNISAPSAPHIQYQATVTNNSAIVNLPVSGSSYLTTGTGSTIISGKDVFLDSAKLYGDSIRQLYVSPTGSDSNDGLTLTSSLATIQKAVDLIPYFNNTAGTRLQYHTIINVASGTYNEKVNILNKSIAGNKSNLLLQIKGEKQTLYNNIAVSSLSATDIDSGDGTGGRYITLNFPSTPANNSLKGCYLYINNALLPDTYMPIYGNSGSTCYVPAYAGNLFLPQSGTLTSIYKPATVVNGFFRSAGGSGVISFRDITLNVTPNEAGGNQTFFFSGVNYSVGTADETFSDMTSSAGSTPSQDLGSFTIDNIRAYNCNVFVTGGLTPLVGPRTYLRMCYVSGSGGSTLFNRDPGDAFRALYTIFEGMTFSISNFKELYLFNCHTYNSPMTLTSIPNITLPIKMHSNSTNTITMINSRATSLTNTYLKGYGFSLGQISYLTMPGVVTNHGPWNPRAFSIQGNSYLDLGTVNQALTMSGSVTGDRLFFLNNKGTATIYGNLNLANVYSPNAFGLFTGYRSDVIFQNSLPVVAASGSANYRSTSDVHIDDTPYFYADLPLITSEGSKIDNRLLPSNARVLHNYPMQTVQNFTITGSAQLISSLVKLTPYATLPTGSLGLMAVSGSSLYFHNGSAWNKVI